MEEGEDCPMIAMLLSGIPFSVQVSDEWCREFWKSRQGCASYSSDPTGPQGTGDDPAGPLLSPQQNFQFLSPAVTNSGKLTLTCLFQAGSDHVCGGDSTFQSPGHTFASERFDIAGGIPDSQNSARAGKTRSSQRGCRHDL